MGINRKILIHGTDTHPVRMPCTWLEFLGPVQMLYLTRDKSNSMN